MTRNVPKSSAHVSKCSLQCFPLLLPPPCNVGTLSQHCVDAKLQIFGERPRRRKKRLRSNCLRIKTFWVQAMFDDVPTCASRALMFFLSFLRHGMDAVCIPVFLKRANFDDRSALGQNATAKTGNATAGQVPIRQLCRAAQIRAGKITARWLTQTYPSVERENKKNYTSVPWQPQLLPLVTLLTTAHARSPGVQRPPNKRGVG